MAHLKGLNPRQLDVLRWIVDGCPDRAWPNSSYKTTAFALQNRNLVQVSKKGGVWRATATAAGEHYAAHGRYPDDDSGAQPQAHPPSARRPAPGTAAFTASFMAAQPAGRRQAGRERGLSSHGAPGC